MGFIREHVVKRLTRSSKWPKVRKEYIKNHPECEACGRTDGLEVHHVRPFHTHPELELEECNLMTLCDKGMKCHFTFGHLGHWKCWNPLVESHAAAFIARVKKRRCS